MTIKNELLEHINNTNHDMILCAEVSYSDRDDDYEDVHIYLHIDGNVNEFVNKLDINLDRIHALDITIWWKDGTWSTWERDFGDDRYNYWIHHARPDIPEYLNKEISIII